MTTMIVLDRLVKRFGPIVAVDGISLAVPKGEVLGFLGPNGAGKTTTMRMIAGFIEPTAGTAFVCGFNARTHGIEAKRRLGYLPEGAPLYGDMTCAAFLEFIARLRGFHGQALTRRVQRAVERLHLEEVLARPIEALSKGFKRRVGLAQAILHDPEVLILDEPTDGLDPNQKHEVRALIRDMAASKAIIVSTHILEEVEAVCTRAVIIAHGKVVADGNAETLLRHLPQHNAAAVTVPKEVAEQAQAALAPLGTLMPPEDVADGVILRLPATDGHSPVAQAAAALAAAEVPIRALVVERGRLDEAFRQLTADAAAEQR